MINKGKLILDSFLYFYLLEKRVNFMRLNSCHAACSAIAISGSNGVVPLLRSFDATVFDFKRIMRKVVDLKGETAKSAIQVLREWDATLKGAGFQWVNNDIANSAAGMKKVKMN